MTYVLIIEDEDNLREALEDALTTAGYQVNAVETSEKGLISFKERVPDVVLLDIMTHSLHGAAFLDRLTMLGIDLNQCKIIVLTALENDIAKQKMQAHPIAEYLVKSNTSLDTIVQKVAAHART
jgi:DNA-binding response OmpR family regulator